MDLKFNLNMKQRLREAKVKKRRKILKMFRLGTGLC